MLIVTRGNSDHGVIWTIGHVVYYCLEWSELHLPRSGRQLEKLAHAFYMFTPSLSSFIVPLIGAWLQGKFDLKGRDEFNKKNFSRWFFPAIELHILPFVYCFSTFGAQSLALCLTVLVSVLVTFCKRYGVYCFRTLLSRLPWFLYSLVRTTPICIKAFVA